jgi:rhamnose utilization protein RhaD (predicted bifunctional aldolase and dehydrogenase)
MEILSYINKKSYPVVKMTPEEINKYYSPMILNFHGLAIWTNEHQKRYDELIEKRKNEAYMYTSKKDKGIIVFSVLDKNIKWSFVPEMKRLF